MSLIAIIVALTIERLIDHLPERSTPRLLTIYVQRTQQLIPWKRLWEGPFAVLLLILPPLALTFWLQEVMSEPVPDLLFSCGVLILCLGPRDFAEDVRRWLEAREAGEHDKALKLGRALQQGPRRYSDEQSPQKRNLIGSLFIQSHERLFGVLIWFVVAGPVGAVLYRSIARLPRLMYERSGESRAVAVADTLHSLLAWVPARLTAALYGLAGSLDDAITEYRRLRHQTNSGWRSHTWAVLAEVSSGSLQFEDRDGGAELPANLQEAAREVLRMQFRSLIILLAIVALLTGGNVLW